MNQNNDKPQLVIPALPVAIGFARAGIHTHRALGQSNAFFNWCSDFPCEPISEIVGGQHDAAGQQWRELVIAQSMDVFADIGMNAILWAASLQEALGQIAHLSVGGTHTIGLEGFAMALQSTPRPERVMGPRQGPEARLGVLTMDDVSRALGYASAQLPAIAAWVGKINPQATRVEQGMLASALLTALAVGPMTGYRQALVGGPHDPWHADLRWEMSADYAGPQNFEQMAMDIAAIE